MWQREIADLSRCADKLMSKQGLNEAQLEHMRKLDLVEACINNGIWKPKEICQQVGVVQGTIYAMLRKLERQKRIKTVPINRQSRMYVGRDHV